MTKLPLYLGLLGLFVLACKPAEPVAPPTDAIDVDESIYVGGSAKKIYAVNAQTGSKRWESAISESARRYGQAVADGVLYDTSGDRKLMALAASSGLQRWEALLVDHAQGPPIVDQQTVYVATGQTAIRAFDLTDGSLRWASTSGNTGLMLANNTLYAMGSNRVTGRSGLYAFAPDAGQQRWLFPTNAIGRLYADQERIYVVEGAALQTLHAIRQSTGVQQWEVALTSSGPTPVYIDKGTIYVLDMGKLMAINAVDGKSKWTYNASGAARFLYVQYGVVYVGGDQKLIAINSDTGQQKWTAEIPNLYVATDLKATTDAVYIGCSLSGVALYNPFYALDLATGVIKWSYLAGHADAVVGYNHVYLTTLSKQIIALDRLVGSTKWTFQVEENLTTEMYLTDQGGKVIN